MKTRDALIQAIDNISEDDQVKLLSVIDLYQNGVEISRFYRKRPVVTMEELAKTNIAGYFDDGLTEYGRYKTKT